MMGIKRGTTRKRLDAIESGVAKAVDGVYKKKWSRNQAFLLLRDFASGELNLVGLEDDVGDNELRWAQRRFPV